MAVITFIPNNLVTSTSTLAVVSGTTVDADYPLANLLVKYKSAVCKLTGSSNSTAFMVTLDSVTTVNAVFLSNHNVNTQVQVDLYDVNSVLLSSTGFVDTIAETTSSFSWQAVRYCTYVQTETTDAVKFIKVTFAANSVTLDRLVIGVSASLTRNASRDYDLTVSRVRKGTRTLGGSYLSWNGGWFRKLRLPVSAIVAEDVDLLTVIAQVVDDFPVIVEGHAFIAELTEDVTFSGVVYGYYNTTISLEEV